MLKKIPLSIFEDLIGFVGRPMNQAAPHPGRRQALQQDAQSGRFLSKGGLGAGAESKRKERVVCKPGPLLLRGRDWQGALSPKSPPSGGPGNFRTSISEIKFLRGVETAIQSCFAALGAKDSIKGCGSFLISVFAQVHLPADVPTSSWP